MSKDNVSQYLDSQRVSLSPVDAMGEKAAQLDIISELLNGPISNFLEAIVQNPGQFRFILDAVGPSGEMRGAAVLVDYIQDAGYSIVNATLTECTGELTESRITFLKKQLGVLTNLSSLLSRASLISGLEALQTDDLQSTVDQAITGVNTFLDGQTSELSSSDNSQDSADSHLVDESESDVALTAWETSITDRARAARASDQFETFLESANHPASLEDLSSEQREVLHELEAARDYGQLLQRLISRLETATHSHYRAVHELLRNTAAREQIQQRLIQLSSEVQQRGRLMIDELASRQDQFGRSTSFAWLTAVRLKLDLEQLNAQTTKLSSLNLTSRLGFDDAQLDQAASNLSFITYARQRAGADDADASRY